MVLSYVRIDVILYKVTKYLSNYKILDYNIFFINISHLVSSSVLWYFLANAYRNQADALFFCRQFLSVSSVPFWLLPLLRTLP